MIQVDFKKNIQKSFVLTSQKGFTLAEVLITIVIIGIVAALTIPALLTSIENEQFQTAYKKAFADGSAAFISAKSNEEIVSMPSNFDTPSAKANWQTFKSKFITIKTCESNNNGNCWDQTGEKVYLNSCPTTTSYAFIDNQGRAWSMYSYNESLILCDTNGFKPPNQYGKDRWVFAFSNQSNTRVGDLIKFNIPFLADKVNVDADWCPSGGCYYLSWLTNTK